MLKTIGKLDETLVKIECAFLIPLFAIMIGLIFIQVIFRYFLELPLGWSEEIVRYLFVIVTFLGGTVATREREHIEIDFITTVVNKYENRPEKQKWIIKITNVIRDSTVIVFMSIVGYQAWFLMIDQYTLGMISPALLIPLCSVTGFMLISMLLMVMHSIFLIVLNVNDMGKTGYEQMEGDAV